MSFDFNGDGDVTHKESAAGFLILAASTITIVISAITTYGFFSAYFPSIVSPAMFGPMYATMISGLIGVIVFDLMTVTFLMAFLYHAGTPEQRAISLTMVFLTFGFSAIASAAHLYMSASGNMAQDGATLSTLRNVAMVAVVSGVVIDFGAWISYTRYSYGSKQRVREADRRDSIQRAEAQQANYLDTLVQQKVKEELEGQASELASLQASRIAGIFAARERAKYHTNKNNPPTPPQSQEAGYRVQLRENGRWQTKVSYPDQGHALDVARTWRNELETDTRVLAPDGTEIVVYVHMPDGRETTPDSSQETEAERQRAYAAQNREYANRNEERAAKLDAARERVIAANGNGHNSANSANFTRGGL